ncbi:MAG: hypothetical protein AAB465_03350 [Patescibacteria group bacterium]
MFITVHSASGAYIGRLVHDPVLAFLIGIISHFVLDFIPHDDSKLTKPNELRLKLFFIGLIDGLIAVLCLFMLRSRIDLFSLSIMAGVAGTIIPDIPWLIYKLFSVKCLEGYYNFHKIFHRKKINIKYWQGVTIQIIFLIILTYLIIK